MKYIIEDVINRENHDRDYERIGELVEIIDMEVGKSAVFAYLNSDKPQGFVTSIVETTSHSFKDGIHRCQIQTKNSIYYLKEFSDE